MEITIAEYDSIWADMFERERRELAAIIGQVVQAIEHIGSTAVVNLPAKPIIDIMVGLKNFRVVDAIVLTLIEQGYLYFPEYEDEMPERRVFKKIVAGRTVSHIHMVEFAGKFWHRHLLFRDYLRTNPHIAQQYAQLKTQLSKKDWQDSNDYANAKTDFIRKIEKQATEHIDEY